MRVTFLAPKDLVARTAGGDSVVLSAVRELSGSVVRARLDTRMDSLRVRLGSARDESGVIDGIPEGAIVAVPRTSFVRIDQETLDVANTLKVVVLAAGTVTLLGLYFVIWAMGQS